MTDFMKIGACFGNWDGSDGECKDCMVSDDCRNKTLKKVKKVEIKLSDIEKLVEELKKNDIEYNRKIDKGDISLYDLGDDIKIYICYNNISNEIQTKIKEEEMNYGILSTENLEQITNDIIKRL